MILNWRFQMYIRGGAWYVKINHGKIWHTYTPRYYASKEINNVSKFGANADKNETIQDAI